MRQCSILILLAAMCPRCYFRYPHEVEIHHFGGADDVIVDVSQLPAAWKTSVLRLRRNDGQNVQEVIVGTKDPIRIVIIRAFPATQP